MSAFFELPLQHAPILVNVGVGRHGRADSVTTETYRLPQLWCLHFYRYRAVLTVGEEGETVIPIEPQGVSLVPPGLPLRYEYPTSVSHLYAHFSLLEASDFAAERGRFWYFPHEISGDFERAFERFVAAHFSGQKSGSSQNSASPRAAVALWELLWQLAELSPHERAPSAHPALQNALQLIEARLDESLSVASLAREVGLCHNHLTRLLREHTGSTVVAYIRRRRALRAQHLLQNSTLPIKTVARQVGVPNLGQFNHLLRREIGVSPRQCRAQNPIFRS